MTNLKSVFPRSAFVGFDHLLEEIDRATHQQSTYPPHNITKIDDETYFIEMALAGFKETDLKIEVKDSNLNVAGCPTKPLDREYIHRGISSKSFVRNFKLAEHVVVKEANFIDGILTIELKVVLPEEKRPRLIEIGTTKPKALLTESA